MVASHALRRAVLVSFGVLFSCLSAAAQVGSGGISGIVMDNSGGVLPGATVKLTSAERVVGGNQETVANERGGYEFLGLVSGRYTVRAELSGFRPAEQQNVVVNAQVVARADLKLEVGQLEESVTVSGSSPLLDTTTVLKQTVISREALDALPNRTDMWSMARIAPGVVINKVDTGGTERFLQSTLSVRGSNGENKYVLDSMDTGGIAGTGAGLLLYFDPFVYDEFSFQAGAATAETSVGGVTVNMVTRNGTNQFHGSAMLTYTPPAWARTKNYSSAVRAQLLANVPPPVLAANPGLEPQADILKMVDTGVWFGGPIIKDRLWFNTAYSDQRMDRYKLGNYDLAGRPVIDDNLMITTANKVSWQIQSGMQLSYFHNWQHKVIGHRGGGTFGDEKARQYSTKYPTVNQLKYTTAIGSAFTVDMGFNRLVGDDIFGQRPEVAPGDVARMDTTTQVATVALPTYNTAVNQTRLFKSQVGWFRGAHTVTAGYERRQTVYGIRNWSTSGLRALYANGVPTAVNTYLVPLNPDRSPEPSNMPVQYQLQEHTNGAFVQHRWRPTNKLAINTGLRYETQMSFQPRACRPDTQFYPGECVDRIDAPTFASFAPRFNMVYDLRGDGRTALKFAINRYNQQLSVSMISRLGSTAIVSDQRQWLPQSRCNDAGVTGCDRNGDLVPQIGELGTAPGYVFPQVNARYEGGLDRPISNEFSLELQHQLPGEVVASVGYSVRQTRRNIGQSNTAVSLAAWGAPISVTEVTSGRSVNVWRRPNTASALYFYNDALQNTDFHGVDLTFNKRMSRRWSMVGGATFGKVTRDGRAENQNDPHVASYFNDTNVTLDNRPWSYRLSGTYELPYQVSVSGTWQYMAGAPEVTTVLVTNQTIALPQGNQSVQVAAVGDVRYPNVASTDLTFRRPIRLAGTRTLSPRLQIFNVFNNATIQAWVTQLGPTYHRPSDMQRGRLINFDMTFGF